jgi:hypothetical protein
VSSRVAIQTSCPLRTIHQLDLVLDLNVRDRHLDGIEPLERFPQPTHCRAVERLGLGPRRRTLCRRDFNGARDAVHVFNCDAA